MMNALIVDDSRVVRKVAKKILENLQFECSEAANGAEALDACAKSMPDLVLLDWNMPVMNGLDFLKQLRKLPGGTTPKVIFATVENTLGQIEIAYQAGANEYIMKPFDQDIIETKLAQTGLL